MATPSFIANPPPYLGQRDDIPIAALKGPYCQRLLNFNTKNSKVSLRKTDTSFGTLAAGSVVGLARYGTGNKLIVCANIGGANALRVLDMTAGGGGSSLYNPAVANTFTFTTFNEFNGSFYIWGDNSLATLGGVYYNGTTGSWGSTPYTLPVGFTPIASTTFKRRHYILKNQGTVVAYSDLDALTGTLATRDFASELSLGGYFVGIKTVSLSNNIRAEKYFVLISNLGEVLAYRGSYLDGSDWEIAGGFVISPPLGYNSFIDFRGDVLVITEAGLFSLRDLFLSGNQSQQDLAISSPIKNRWAQTISAHAGYSSTALGFTTGCFDSSKNRILVQFRYDVDFDTGLMPISGGNGRGLCFVYNISEKSWSEHSFGGVGDNGFGYIANYNKNVYFVGIGNSGIYKKEASSNSNALIFQIRSAPLDTQKFGVNRGAGVELLMASDQYSEIDVSIILDLGREDTTAVIDSDPGSSGGVVKNLYDTGGEGSYIQYQIDGIATTGSVGFDLYGVNYWNIAGDAPR